MHRRQLPTLHPCLRRLEYGRVAGSRSGDGPLRDDGAANARSVCAPRRGQAPGLGVLSWRGIARGFVGGPPRFPPGSAWHTALLMLPSATRWRQPPRSPRSSPNVAPPSAGSGVLATAWESILTVSSLPAVPPAPIWPP